MESENKRFKRARQELGLTLRDLVLLSGYSASTISGVENGHDAPSKRLRQLLIDRLGINEDWLRTGRGKIFEDSPQTSLAKIITNPESPTELNIGADPEFVGVINKLRVMPFLERKQHLVAMERLLNELVERDKKAKAKKSINQQFQDKTDRLFAELLLANAEDQLSKTKRPDSEPIVSEESGQNKSKEGLDIRPGIPDSARVRKKIESLPDLLAALRERTKLRGQKAALARELKVTRQAIDQWLSGNAKPSAEITFELLKRVEQQERQK